MSPPVQITVIYCMNMLRNTAIELIPSVCVFLSQTDFLWSPEVSIHPPGGHHALGFFAHCIKLLVLATVLTH